ncbi:MAG: helix-turn-helix domain-containing protein [Verrucomicrobiales bacterium]
MDEVISVKLRLLREKNGWTLKEAEEASGVHLSYISAIENGRRKAGPETLTKLAEAYQPQRAHKLRAELMSLRADQRKTEKFLQGYRPGTITRAVSEGIATLRGESTDSAPIEVVSEDERFEIDWEKREVTKGIRISAGGESFKVRISISSEAE